MTGEVTNSGKTHPLIIVAAVAVTLLCAAGIASIMGWLPPASSLNTQSFQAPATPPAPEPAPPKLPALAAAPQRIVPSPALKPAAPPRTVTPPAPAKPAPHAPAAPVPSYLAQGNTLAITPPPVVLPRVCKNCGVISSITPIEKKGEGSGAGAVLGGILGGVAGHQVGAGRGRDAATVAGAVGGAYLGNEVEKSGNRSYRYEVRVRMEDGAYRTVGYNIDPGYRVGDKVHVENGTLYRE